MHRNMRRFRQALGMEACEAVMQRGTSGVLALCGEDGPYAVPLSYAYMDGKVIFHCAKEGHKLDCVRYDSRASFCVVDQDEVIPERYTTYYRSVIAFGRIREVTDRQEMISLCAALGMRYRPGHREDVHAEIEGALSRLCVLVMDVEEMTGKEARELMEQREAARRES
ncbi:MAG: pyridoxamine 5'-phosphate oxidase family protein [Clostridia bacterium]|nr:pyridoxamine 5'-phosphate oxidase family protein [Clostridia bacterium]